MRSRLFLGRAAFALAVALVSSTVLAGPPFVTDDPEPIPHRHWELYAASQSSHDAAGWTATAPHLEANYGVVPDVQLHVLAPFVFADFPETGRHYGFGDMELGSKIRFVHEATMPQIGTYPMLEVPTGRERLGLGNGTAQVFVPLWFQKSFGEWTTYGGPGFWMDLGGPERHWWYFGWEAQRRLAEFLTLGAEVFYLTPKGRGDEHDVRFDAGAMIDITGRHHVLLSAGRGIIGPNRFQSYAAYLVTLGPELEE